MAGRRMAALVLSDEERAELASLAARRNTAQALALRARIVLRCATGVENQQVAADLRIDKTTVGKWRRRLSSAASMDCGMSARINRVTEVACELT